MTDEIFRASAPETDVHLSYLERLLAGTDAAAAPADFLYLVRPEEGNGFWELIGFRVAGLSRALVGAVLFQNQTREAGRFARRPLGHFLSSPPQNIGLDRSTYPADLIELRVPRADETVPDLLGRLKRGEPTETLYVDADMLEIAWDFRRENPSLERPRMAEGPRQNLLLRTREGHVLAGRSANMTSKLRSNRQFLALTAVEQWLPDRNLPLPTLVVHRRYLTMVAETPDSGRPEAMPLAFAADTINPFHLLDPRLGV